MAAKKFTVAYKDCKINDIIAYCVENEKVDWLKSIMASRPQFFTVKKAFYTSFAPALLPKKKAKKPTMYDVVDAL